MSSTREWERRHAVEVQGGVRGTQVQAVRPATLPTVLAVSGTRTRRLRLGLPFYLSVFGAYLAAAAFLVFQRNLLVGDAISRVGIALRILYSRDPHLAAVGFVWSPLPPLTLLPFIPLKAVWPGLVSVGFAGNLVSALFMAGAVYQLHGILKDSRVNPVARVALTAAFALHPLIVFSAANGMTEAPAIFFLLLSTRHLARWIDTGEVASKVYCGLWLAPAYLTRYDAAAAAAATCVVVLMVSFVRGRGLWKAKLATAVSDAVLVGAPFAFAFVMWALISWLIVGQPFEQFTSAYGTAAQLRVGAAATGIYPSTAQMFSRALLAVFVINAFLVPFVLFALLGAWRRRDLRPAAILAVLGAVLVFMIGSYATGTILPSLRYLIIAVPLGTVMAGYALAPAKPRAASSPSLSSVRSQVRRLSVAGFTLVTVAVVVLSLPIAVLGLLSPRIDPDEGVALQAALNPGPLNHDQQLASNRFTNDRQIAAYLDGRHLQRGSVLVDEFLGYAIVLASAYPDQFVITSDRDFRNVVADPAGTGVKYILVPATTNLGRLDALNTAYPHIYDSGAGLGTLETSFADASDYRDDWRLFRINAKR
jgi:hypothetical protein